MIDNCAVGLRTIEEMSADLPLTVPPAASTRSRRAELLIVAVLADVSRRSARSSSVPRSPSTTTWTRETTSTSPPSSIPRRVVPRCSARMPRNCVAGPVIGPPEFLVTPDVYLQPQQIVRPSVSKRKSKPTSSSSKSSTTTRCWNRPSITRWREPAVRGESSSECRTGTCSTGCDS